METKAELLKAINTLMDYCDNQDTCKGCVFKPCHTDSDIAEKVYMRVMNNLEDYLSDCEEENR
jgi:hypothetical protein